MTGTGPRRRSWGRSRLLSAVLAVAVCLPPALVAARGEPVGAAPAAPASPAAERAAAVANVEWLHGQLDDGRYANPLASGPDHGLMMDVVFAMHAARRPDLATPIVRVLDDEAHVQDYVSLSGWRPRPDPNRLGGQLAKSVVTALVSGRDPRNFGGMDLVAELRASIVADGPNAGRVTDHGPLIQINNTNTFGQALAVIAFAGIDEHPSAVVDKLLWQQCSEGYFRIFYSFNTDHSPATCDEGKARDRSAPDRDSTGLGLSALLAAQRAGAPGLEDPIDRARRWLVAEQQPGGGWGGGVSTEDPNTNSTGLIVQALADAGGAEAAVAAGQAYLRASQVTVADVGNDLRTEVGAIAYRPEEYLAARQGGIVGADTWIRAGGQASLGLALVGFYDLVTGNVDLPEPPRTTTTVPAPTTTVAPRPPATATTTTTAVAHPEGERSPGTSTRAGKPGPDPRRSIVDRIVAGAGTSSTGEAPPDTPGGRLAGYLVGQLADGDHVEEEIGGERVVDYEATADLALALRAVGELPDAARRITAFLLDADSVDAYVHGVPYEAIEATYVEPLAKLLVLAGFQQRDAEAPDPAGGRLEALAAELRARREGGELVDVGQHGDRTRSTVRHAWAILALVATGDRAADEVDALLAVRCDDGGFPIDLSGAACAESDPTATALGLRALVAGPASVVDDGPQPHRPANRATPAGWTAERSAAVAEALAALDAAVDERGLVVADGVVDLAASGSVTGTRAFVGTDVDVVPTALAELQGADGGFAVEPAEPEEPPVIERAPARAPAADTARTTTTDLSPAAAEGSTDPASDLAASIGAAEGLAGRSWADDEGSPVIAALRVHPVAATGAAEAADRSGAADRHPPEVPAEIRGAGGGAGAGRVLPVAVALVLLAGSAAVVVVVRRRSASAAATLT